MTHTHLKPVFFKENELDDLTSVTMEAHGQSLKMAYGLAAVPNGTFNKVKGSLAGIMSFYPERFEDLDSQAAALACRLAKDHCFPDGNKRTAVLMAITLMEAYGNAVACSQDDFVQAGLAAARNDISTVKRLLASE
jgi:death-on-curing family protein